MIMSRISKEERLLFLAEMPTRKERYTIMVNTTEPEVKEEETEEEVEETEEETEEEETKEEETE